MINKKYIMDRLDKLIPNPECELNYNKDYELLLATVLSAQATDKMVNKVTKELFKYNLNELKNIDIEIIKDIIKPVGTYTKKANYIKEISKRLLNDYNGIVPENRKYLESLPGVGRKTTNLILSNLFNIPAFAVDTHVERVTKRLGLVDSDDSVNIIEEKLMQLFPKNKWSRLHHQFVLFGRYTCKSQKPNCLNCPFINFCKYKNN